MEANHRTHSALCDDPAASPLGLGEDLVNNITQQYLGWSASVANPLTGAQLREEVLMDMGARLSGGMGGFVTDANATGGTLQVLHSVHKHAGPSHRGKVHACRGDALEVDIDVLKFEDELLGITGEHRIADGAGHQQELFDAAPDIELVPEFAANAARTGLVKTRNTMHLPAPLPPHVLERNLTAREAFETLCPIVQDLGLEAAAEPLLDFLLVASAQSGTAPNLTTGVRRDDLGPLQGSRAITQDRRENLLCRHLPALRPASGPQSDPALLGIMNCLRDQRNANSADLNDRRLEREKASAPQTAEGKWPTHIDRLCKLCDVQDWEDLPACWHDAAAWKRGAGTALCSVLEEATRVAARELGVSPPQITVQHANSLQNWLFIGPTIHCVGNGLVPMTVTPPHGVSLKAKRRIALDYEQAADDATMIQGSGNVTAADARALRTGAHVPVNFDEAEASLEAHGAIPGASMGTSHKLVKDHFSSLKAHGRVREQLKQITSRRFGEPLAAAAPACHHHVNMHCWFEEQWNQDATDTVAAPPFGEGFRSFARGNNLSWLPDATPVEAFGSLQPTESPEPTAELPSPAPAAPVAAPRPPRERARNRNRDGRLVGDSALAARMRRTTVRDAIAKAGTPPPNSGDTERCLSWHLKGNCFADCPRKADHIVLEGADEESLFEWVKKAHAEWETGKRNPHPSDAEPAARPVDERQSKPRVSEATQSRAKSNSHAITPELGKNAKCDRRACIVTPPPRDTSELRACAPTHIPRRPPSSPRVPETTAAPARSPSPAFPAFERAPTGTVGSEPLDELDVLVAAAAERFERSASWEEFFDTQRDPRGDWGEVETSQHPAAHPLSHCKHRGVPIEMTTPPWPEGRRQAALQRGPHKSAKEHRHFLRTECIDMIKKGHWVLLPARPSEGHSKLRLSPSGVAPQRERRPRTISDCSHFGVNQETLKLAPPEAMQFGRALQRVLQKTFDANPRYGPVCLAKIDIADGFCRIGLRPADAPQLAVLFPTDSTEEPLVSVPLTLPMGWAESPPAFCTATETIADLANRELAADPKLRNQPPHRLDELAETKVPSNGVTQNDERSEGTSDRMNQTSESPDLRTTRAEPAQSSASAAARSAARADTGDLAESKKRERIRNNCDRSGTTSTEFPTANTKSATGALQIPVINRATESSHHGRQHKSQRPLRHWDVCVDDFLGLTQGNPGTRRRAKRTVLHALDKVFRPLEPTDNSHRQEPASAKKLKKGDAAWTTRKVMLGWMTDTERGTIELPEHRKQRLAELLEGMRPGQRCVTTKDWHKVPGELRSMAMAIPGARGLFSMLQEAFRHEEAGRPRLRLTKAAHAFINDFRWMSREMAARPTRIAELVPTEPAVIGACDAAGEGMGGVCFVPAAEGIQPWLWRTRFPDAVRTDLVGTVNPRGSITNSDLELCGNVAHHDAMARNVDVRERTLWTASDNQANVHWNLKGSTTTAGPPACPLRVQAFHQRFHRHLHTHDCIPGPANAMADFCSRAWHLDDSQLLAHFDRNCPQTRPWRACQPTPELLSSLISALWRKPSCMASAPRLDNKRMNTGRHRTGAITPSHRAVRAAAASSVLCSVGQTFLRMGSADPRPSANGKQDFRLARQLRSCTKADPPPSRVRPAPITLISFLLNTACNASSPLDQSECALADMICAAFHFLLRPGECAGTANDDAAFRLADAHLCPGARRLDSASSPTRLLEAATSVSLHFTTQKNQRKGDAIAHGRSNHPLCCPVRSVVRPVLRHRRWFASKAANLDTNTKLAACCHRDARCAIRATDVTQQLRFAADACFHSTGLQRQDISAGSLRAGGAMALLFGDVDTDTIEPVGRWHSDAMMRYLHQDVNPVKQRLARKMCNNGRHSFLPSHTVPVRRPAPPTAAAAAPPDSPTPQDSAPISTTRTPPPPSTPPTPVTPPLRRSRRMRGVAPEPLPRLLPRQLRPRNRSPQAR